MTSWHIVVMPVGEIVKNYSLSFLLDLEHYKLIFESPLTLEALKKIVTLERWGGGGGREVSIGPPSTFETIHPISMKFGTYNKLHLYFQLSETT